MMASNVRIKKDFDEVSGWREGARYCKIDLHTHTPASECSDFALPAEIESQFPQGKRSKKSGDPRYEFLGKLAGGKNPFKKPYESKKLSTHPRLAKRPKIETSVMRKIANVWLEDIKRNGLEDTSELTDEQGKQRDELVNQAFANMGSYLKSLFFPEEFVVRCYIERLQLVALVDHNHPGYIVPRVPELGTWYSAIVNANQAYDDDIKRAKRPGEQVRKVLLQRLKIAEKQLPKAGKKKVKERKARLKRINARLAEWMDSENKPLRLGVLPGTEITVSDVHLLAVFPPEWYAPGRIGGILRSIGIPEAEWGKAFLAAATSSVQDTITLVDEAEGIVVPAHCNSDHKGLLRLFPGGLALNKALEHPALIALEIVKGAVKKGKNGKKGKTAWETLKWLDTGQWRAERSKPITFVRGSDAHECRIEYKGKGADLGDRFTYVKLDIRPEDTPEEIFRSLRLALLCGQSRVLEWPAEDGYNYYASGKESGQIKRKDRIKLLECEARRRTILGITVEGEDSYAGCLSLRFNPYLNCVVGNGGKSAIVRLVGYGFGAMSFMDGTSDDWLPTRVRVFWREGSEVYCVERAGKDKNPAGEGIKRITWFQRLKNGNWKETSPKDDPEKLVDVWPSPKLKDLSEEELIARLLSKLKVTRIENAKPLLVTQPRNIFNSEKIFNEVLAKPHFKARQIIWSARSPNIPTALDAEKIIVTGEMDEGRHMKVLCAGDLHEDEIRDQFLSHMEGGWPGFARRETLYRL
jgi:hypothetical protein